MGDRLVSLFLKPSLFFCVVIFVVTVSSNLCLHWSELMFTTVGENCPWMGLESTWGPSTYRRTDSLHVPKTVSAGATISVPVDGT